MQVGNEELIVENFKTHLKDRNLIKFKDFDTIESIERLGIRLSLFQINIKMIF